jgi:hypothetical protein
MLMLMLIVTGCAVDADPAVTTSQSDLTCGSFCDPGDPMDQASELEFARTWGGHAFPDSTVVGASCANIAVRDDDPPDYECVEHQISTANPCGPIAVSCYRQQCHYQLIDRCH